MKQGQSNTETETTLGRHNVRKGLVYRVRVIDQRLSETVTE